MFCMLQRFVHRENVERGTFWRKVKELYDEIEKEENTRKTELYRGLVRNDDNTMLEQ